MNINTYTAPHLLVGWRNSPSEHDLNSEDALGVISSSATHLQASKQPEHLSAQTPMFRGDAHRAQMMTKGDMPGTITTGQSMESSTHLQSLVHGSLTGRLCLSHTSERHEGPHDLSCLLIEDVEGGNGIGLCTQGPSHMGCATC